MVLTKKRQIIDVIIKMIDKSMLFCLIELIKRRMIPQGKAITPYMAMISVN